MVSANKIFSSLSIGSGISYLNVYKLDEIRTATMTPTKNNFFCLSLYENVDKPYSTSLCNGITANNIKKGNIE